MGGKIKKNNLSAKYIFELLQNTVLPKKVPDKLHTGLWSTWGTFQNSE
jgi:hypothetical protein